MRCCGSAVSYRTACRFTSAMPATTSARFRVTASPSQSAPISRANTAVLTQALCADHQGFSLHAGGRALVVPAGLGHEAGAARAAAPEPGCTCQASADQLGPAVQAGV